MKPSHQNLLAFLGTIVYVKVLIGCCDIAVTRRWLPSDISRKIIHVGAGCWCLFWPYFSQDHWTWQLNVGVPAVYTVQLAVKGLLLNDPSDPDVLTMSRSGRPIELCQGPLLFTLVMVYCGLYQFRTDLGVFVMGALGFGDGIAPLFGKRYPWGHYPTYGKGERKTLSGSLAMFTATVIGITILQAYILGDVPSGSGMARTFRISAVATLAEGIAGKWDNPVIASAVVCYYNAFC